MSNYSSDFETKKNQTFAKTKDQLNYRATIMIQDIFRALFKFIKQMLASVLGK
jgi:hypothetical protein